PVFDPLAAAEVAATVTLADLLAPERLNRLELLNPGDAAQPRPEHVFAGLIDRALRPATEPVQRRVATTIILALARVQRDPALSPTIALALSDRLARLAGRLAASDSEWSRG